MTPGLRFDSLFADPRGRATRVQFVTALLTLLAVVAFYLVLVRSRTGTWSQLVLLFPAAVLHARRLHHMGRTAWLVLVPLALMLAAFGIWLDLVSFGAAVDRALPPIALVVAGAFALVCSLVSTRQ